MCLQKINICNRKKTNAHASESVCFRKSNQTWRCNVYFLKSCLCFSQGGVNMIPPPSSIGLKNTFAIMSGRFNSVSFLGIFIMVVVKQMY